MTLAELAVEVAAGIAECPDFVALGQVQRATAKLLDKSRLWRCRFSYDYPGTFPLPDGAELAGFIQLKANGRTIDPTPPGDIGDGDLPEGFWLEQGALTLAPRPRKPVRVEGIAFLTPSGCHIPAAMLTQKVRDAIQNGARHYLFQVPAQPWYSMESADYYGALFAEAWIQLRNQADLGFVDSRRRAKPHFF